MKSYDKKSEPERFALSVWSKALLECLSELLLAAIRGLSMPRVYPFAKPFSAHIVKETVSTFLARFIRVTEAPDA